MNERTNERTNQPASQSVTQSVNQPINQSKSGFLECSGCYSHRGRRQKMISGEASNLRNLWPLQGCDYGL